MSCHDLCEGSNATMSCHDLCEGSNATMSCHDLCEGHSLQERHLMVCMIHEI
jgi:hypothetical protein